MSSLGLDGALGHYYADMTRRSGKLPQKSATTPGMIYLVPQASTVTPSRSASPENLEPRGQCEQTYIEPTPLSQSQCEFERRFHRTRIWEAVYELLETEMARRGWTQKDLAKRLDRDQGWVSRCLRGPSNWQLDTIIDLLAAVDHEPSLSAVPYSIKDQCVSYTLTSSSSTAKAIDFILKKDIGNNVLLDHMKIDVGSIEGRD